jgi:hypothetical protein
MERGSIGESKKSTMWPCMLAERERVMNSELMVTVTQRAQCVGRLRGWAEPPGRGHTTVSASRV